MSFSSSSCCCCCCPFVARTWLLLLCCLSIASYVGEVLRVFCGNLFGNACQQPGTVGWNTGNWAPCTTAPGTTLATGGALFSDLPANMMGCFFMGLFLDGAANDNSRDNNHVQHTLAVVDMPLVFLPRTHSFQRHVMVHFCIRTGFCGSLTTFASWNAQMVVMICAGRGTDLGSTQWVSAVFGYLIGWMVSMSSFLIGRDVAMGLHRHFNPLLKREADMIHGLLVNRALPDFERRFLHDVDLEAYQEEQKQEATNKAETETTSKQRNSSSNNIRHSVECFGMNDNHPHASHFHFLKEWKDTTKDFRQKQRYMKDLHRMEQQILVDGTEPSDDLLERARSLGWDVEALKNWKKATTQQQQDNDDETENKKGCTQLVPPLVASLAIFSGITATLLWVAVDQSGSDPVSIHYRTTALSALFSPLGVMVRWQLTKLNSVKNKWHWFPLGTFVANMSACIIGSLMLGISLRIDSDSHLALSFVAAIKTGFTGSLSTVASFVAETVSLMHFLPRHAWAYYYSICTVVSGGLLGVVSYVWAV